MSDPGFLADLMTNGPEEAKQLLASLGLYAQIGYSRTVGHVHTGRLYGHADYRGKVHAVNGSHNIHSGGGYKALCGETVVADHDGERFNVAAAPDEIGGGVSCKRCKAVIRKKRR